MHPLLEHPSIAARHEIAKLKEATMEFLDPYPSKGYRTKAGPWGGAVGMGSSPGWETVKRYANEIVELLRMQALE